MARRNPPEEVRSQTTKKYIAVEVGGALRKLEGELITRAVQQKVGGIVSPSEVEVVDLDPEEHLGFTNKKWSESIATANDWNRIVDGYDIGDRIVGVVAVVNVSASPLSTGIRFAVGSPITTVKAEFLFEEYFVEDQVGALFSDGVIYDKKTPVTIDQYGIATGTDELVYIGKTAQKLGTKVSPPE